MGFVISCTIKAMARALLVWFAVGAHALMLDTSKQLGRGGGRCVVWHSQHKSAGQAIENRLLWIPMKDTGFERQEWRDCGSRCNFVCDQQTWSCEEQKCIETQTFREGNPGLNVRIAMRGYVQTLRGSPTWGQAGDGKCIWATMSREPTSRLVSAYLYCKHMRSKDALCGHDRLDATKATLQEFAAHWGNYLLRELLWFPELRTMAESRPDFNSEKHCHTVRSGRSMGDEEFTWQEPWVQFKDQLNGGDSIETESGRKNLAAVKDHLLGQHGAKPLYDFIGLVEEWNDSLFLLDMFMPLNHTYTWSQTYGNATGGSHNSWRYADEKASTLEMARKDASVQRAIAGDTALYNDVLVPLFHKQMASYKSAR